MQGDCNYRIERTSKQTNIFCIQKLCWVNQGEEEYCDDCCNAMIAKNEQYWCEYDGCLADSNYCKECRFLCEDE